VAATKEPAWLEDASRDPDFLRASAVGLHAGFMVPVLVGDDVAGVLECFADRPAPRDETLLAILPHIGIQLGRAVERARARTALSESETRFRLLVQNVADYGIYVLDPEGRVSSWNEGAQRMTGYAASETIGRHFSIFYQAGDVARDKPAWELDVAAEEGRFEEDGWRVRKDGSRFRANVLVTALRDPGGALVGFGKIVGDLTERHAAESALRARTEELARSNAELEQFAYVASHDLQEPLRMVATYTQRLQRRHEGKLDAQADKYIAFAVEGAQRMHALIVDLLTLSRVGTQGRPLVPADANAVLAHVLRTLSAAIAENRAEATADPLPNVVGDARQLEQLLTC
jgi:PAS domain S-box-containing protein